ncbi:hypothetical protein [Cohnella abietis]|uniref:Uncharacterized protein n=1 Tax=Cohnella abietis TaxID=2507935 RepID=A0A3T1CZV2_9BACL|nr:hypothetical protein [Cohnella abietis]BBI31373.1 hypothetical protein KCTCHS21_07720 [Cohnella abietis]
MGTASRVKLSQMDALMVESLRALGWTNDELVRKVKAGELPVDESPFHFKYELLTAFAAEEPEVFEASVTEGYQIKYNTVRGIRSWILITFGKEPELLLEEGQEAVHVSLTAEEKEKLANTLSFGWAINEEGQASSEGASLYRIEPIQR